MSENQHPYPFSESAFLDLRALKQRGWTARLVRIFLGEPDDTERVGATHTGRPRNLYSAKRVASVEIHDSQFKAEKEKAALYSGRLKQNQNSKKKNLVGIVEEMMLPQFDLHFEELLEHAHKKIIAEKLAEITSERDALEIF